MDKPISRILQENLISLTVILIACGLFMVFNATSAQFGTSTTGLVRVLKQFSYDMMGLFFAALLAFVIPIKQIKRGAPALALTSLILLLLVLVIGNKINGASRWFRLGSISFQPSELAKIAYVIYFARWLEARQHQLDKIKTGLLPCLGLLALAVGPIIMEPDLGNAFLLTAILSVMMLIAGVPLLHLLCTALVTLPTGLSVLYNFYPHFRERLQGFFAPAQDLMGKGYQQHQGLIGLGSGGLTGKGAGQGLQKLSYLPEAHNDFIFAIVGEDFGFVGCGLLVLVFAILVFQMIRITRRSPDLFSLLTVSGITSLVGGQAIFNMAVVTQLLPNKGISLPLISYGGSNALFTLVALGVVAAVCPTLQPDRPRALGALEIRKRSRPLF